MGSERRRLNSGAGPADAPRVRPQRRILRRLAGSCSLLAILAAATPPAGASIKECRSPSGDLAFTTQHCPKGFSRVREFESAATAKQRGEAADTSRPVAAPTPSPSEPRPALSPATLVSRAVISARFARALSELSALKVYAMSYYVEMGEWARRPSELGLDAATLNSEDIAAVELRPDGELVAHLRQELGHDLRIWLHPEPSMGGASMRWRCRTNIPSDSILPGALRACSS
jgi:hypothetical protein